MEGNFSAPYGGVSVDFAFMDQIVQFNKDDMDVVEESERLCGETVEGDHVVGVKAVLISDLFGVVRLLTATLG